MWQQLSFVIVTAWISLGDCSSWSDWWTYDGISGPDFWGLVNPDWTLCSRGMLQSPVNIEPRRLIYDPYLHPLRVDRQKVGGTLMNNGHDVKVIVEDSGMNYVNVSGGSLIYQYRIVEITIHFGRTDSLGSEHSINGVHFPAEVQIMGYNMDLYGNLSHAIHSTHGLCIISVLVQIGQKPNGELDLILQNVRKIRYKNQQVKLTQLSVDSLLPDTKDYITYEGSLTEPGCQETVTWLILNKPIYIVPEHLTILREVMQGDENNPKVPMANNFRALMPLNRRPIRTNINFQNTSVGCTTQSQVYYQANVLGKV